MNSPDRDVLIESCVSAYRPLGADGNPQLPAAWWDLAPEALDEVFRRQLEARELERRFDALGRAPRSRRYWRGS